MKCPGIRTPLHAVPEKKSIPLPVNPGIAAELFQGS